MTAVVAKEYRPLVRRVRELGCHVEFTRKRHLLIVTPDGQRVVAPGTPSDHRAIKNTTANLRRCGLDI